MDGDMKMIRRCIWIVALLIGVGTVVTWAGAPPPPAPRATATPLFGRGTLTFTQNERRVMLSVEIAESMEARSHGLMLRKSLPENAGMLFVFEEDAKWGFWMKNTLIPLSIGFVDKTWRLIEILDMVVPDEPTNGPFKIYEPSMAYRYALEVNQGLFQRKGLTAGAQVRLTRTP